MHSPIRDPQLENFHRSAVGIWRTDWLPYSETFIRDQASALQRYEPRFLGLRVVQGGLVSRDRVDVGSRTLRQFAPSLELRRRIQSWQQRFDVIHAHFCTDAGFIARYMEDADLPLIITAHGYDVTIAEEFLTPEQRYGRDCAIKRATKIIAVSPFIRERLLALGASPERVVVAPIGTHLPKASVGPTRSNHIVFVGRLVEKKGLDQLVEAVGLMPARSRPSISVVGDGPLREAAIALARRLNVDLRLEGVRSSVETRKLIAKGGVLCVPSVAASNGDAEAFGMVFIEAAAMGVPVVSYDSGGIAYAVRHEISGLLAPERDVQELSACLGRVLGDFDFARQLGAGGRALVEQEFLIEDCTKRLEEIYDDQRRS